MTTVAKSAPPANGNIETLNHFEKIHPKDDLEIKKQRDESVGRTVNKKDNKKGNYFFCLKLIFMNTNFSNHHFQ